MVKKAALLQALFSTAGRNARKCGKMWKFSVKNVYFIDTTMNVCVGVCVVLVCMIVIGVWDVCVGVLLL